MLMTFGKSVLKNLFSKPVTTTYPLQAAAYTPRTRGHIEIEMDKCVLCGLCAKKCPPHAISVDRAEGIWRIARFDCVQCGYCVSQCRKGALTIVPGYPQPQGSKSCEEHRKEEHHE